MCKSTILRREVEYHKTTYSIVSWGNAGETGGFDHLQHVSAHILALPARMRPTP
jgi:hypothetical protein